METNQKKKIKSQRSLHNRIKALYVSDSREHGHPVLWPVSVSFLKQRIEPALAQPQGCLSQCPQRALSSWNWKPPETGAVAKKTLAEAAPPSSSYCGAGRGGGSELALASSIC